MLRAGWMLVPLVLVLSVGNDGLAQTPPPDRRQAFLEMFARAYYPGRSGQIMLVPQEGAVILGRDDPLYRFMHGSPWSYDVDIPLLLFGPAFIERRASLEPVLQQDVAPTLAAVLGLPTPASMTGRALTTALRSSRAQPRAMMLIVLDGMRTDYVDRYAAEMPTLARLRRDGAWFGAARVNYLPSLTSVGHATLATGADPQIHGIAANTTFNRATGRPQGPYPGLSPATLMTLTIADLWNIRTAGRAVIIAQGTTPRATIALAGHGGCLVSGRPIVLAMFDGASGRWQANPDCYRLPGYLRDIHARTAWEQADGRWLDHKISSGSTLLRSGLFPAFQVDALLSMIAREQIGADTVTDLILVNFKTPDYVAHQYGPASAELRAALAALDRELARVVVALDEAAGPEGYVIAISADHGMPPDPAVTGSGRHYVEDIVDLVHDRFDPDGRRLVLFYDDPADNQIFVDTERLAGLGSSLDQIANYLGSLPFIFAAYTEDEVAAAIDR